MEDIKVFRDMVKAELVSMLPEGEDAAFYVLKRILKGNCYLTVTDGENFLMCLSKPVYPLWIWTRDGLDESKYDEIMRIKDKYYASGYKLNVKPELAKYLEMDGYEYDIGMTVYECPRPVQPQKACPGRMVPACKKTFPRFLP